MIGRDLGLVKHPKEKAINLILNGDYEPGDLVKVSYEKTGQFYVRGQELFIT